MSSCGGAGAGVSEASSEARTLVVTRKEASRAATSAGDVDAGLVELGFAESEDDLSFHGGHTSFALSVPAATVTVAAMRGYAGVGIVAGVGFTLSAAVRYLRIEERIAWVPLRAAPRSP